MTVSPDWPKLIADLEAAGLSIYKIALVCNTTRAQIKRIKSGVEPRYSTGELLLALQTAVGSKRP